MRIAVAALAITCSIAPVRAQQPADVLAGTHSVQFENEWVRVVRVRYEARATLPSHTHPGGTTVFLYLNDSEGIVFRHVEAGGGDVTRPPVKTGGLRATKVPVETHTVENTSSTPSNFIRLHFKTDAGGQVNTRRRLPRAAVPEGQDLTRVEYTNKQMRITRIIIQPGHSADVQTTATEPAILVSVADARLTVGGAAQSEITLVPGQERWVPEKRREVVSNTGRVPVELIRVDFLTRPAKQAAGLTEPLRWRVVARGPARHLQAGC